MEIVRCRFSLDSFVLDDTVARLLLVTLFLVSVVWFTNASVPVYGEDHYEY